MPSVGIKIIIFLGQYTIFCNQYNFVNTKALYGHGVRVAESKEFSYVVAICRINKSKQAVDNILCTGSLITRSDILTAAHCIRNRRPNNTEIILGLNVNEGKKYKLLGWITYEVWARDQEIPLIFETNDLALLKLTENVPENISLGVLTNGTYESFYGLEVTTAGWGIMDNDYYPNKLQVVNLQVLSNAECERKISKLQGYLVPIDFQTLCTVAEPIALITSGDSGGPLVYKNEIIGVTRSTCPVTKLKTDPEKVNFHTCIEYYMDFLTYCLEKSKQ